MEFLISIFFLAVIVAIIFVAKAQGNNQGGASNSPSASRSAKSISGQLGFQEKGTQPKKDSEGRVIVKLKGGTPGVSFGVNQSRLDSELANKLAGKVSEDEDFNKSVKVRIRADRDSQYANSVLVETIDSKFLGWILKDDSEKASAVLQEIGEAMIKAAPELEGSEFTFEVSARIEGYWNEVSEEGPEEWEADFELFEIRIKAPVEAEVD